MASTDATAIPVKNQAFRVTFPITTSAGALVAGATGLDSEISKDAGTFTDCTNEATQIATSSGVYYLDLTATEMNADTVAVIVKSTEGLTVPIILYPQEAGDINVDVTYWNGTAVATPTTGGVPEVDITYINGSATAATNLGESTKGILVCNAQGTHSNTSTATDTAGASSVNDFYNGRTIVFVTGSLLGQAARITDYVGATKTFTHSALANSASASNGDDFVVV